MRTMVELLFVGVINILAERSSEDEGDSTNKNDETDETDEAAAAIQLQLDKKGCTFNLLVCAPQKQFLT